MHDAVESITIRNRNSVIEASLCSVSIVWREGVTIDNNRIAIEWERIRFQSDSYYGCNVPISLVRLVEYDTKVTILYSPFFSSSSLSMDLITVKAGYYTSFIIHLYLAVCFAFIFIEFFFRGRAGLCIFYDDTKKKRRRKQERMKRCDWLRLCVCIDCQRFRWWYLFVFYVGLNYNAFRIAIITVGCDANKGSVPTLPGCVCVTLSYG